MTDSVKIATLEVSAVDYCNGEFDGNAVKLVDGSLTDTELERVADLLEENLDYGSQDGSDYAYFWLKTAPENKVGPGSLIHVYEDNTLVLEQRGDE